MVLPYRHALRAVVCGILVCVACSQAVHSDQPAESQPAIKCIFAEQSIKIDGRLDDAAWSKAEVLKFYSASTGSTPEGATEARVLWDSKYLYVAYRAYDRDIWSYYTKRDSWCYQEDVLEVFLKTDPNRDPYYNLEINALGTIYDQLTLRKGAGGSDVHRWNRWNCEGLRVGTDVKGTLNNPDDVDAYWEREMAIPYSQLPTLRGDIPKPGDTWKLLLARYDYSVYLADGVELSTCVPHRIDTFHDDSNWMNLEFAR